MDDPLLLLKDFLKTKKEAALENGKITFREIKFGVDTPVKFKNNDLTLGQVWFFLKHYDEKPTTYLNLCKLHSFNKLPFELRSDVTSEFIPPGVDIKPLFPDRSSADSSASPAVETTASEEQGLKRKLEEGEEGDELKNKRLKKDENETYKNGVEYGGISEEKVSSIHGNILADGPLNEKQQTAKKNFASILDQLTSFNSKNASVDALDEIIKVEDFTPFIEYDQSNLKKLRRKELVSKKVFALHGHKKTDSKTDKGHTRTDFSSILTNVLPTIKKIEVERKKYEEIAKKQKEEQDKRTEYDKAKRKIHEEVRSDREKGATVWLSTVGEDLSDLHINPSGSNIVQSQQSEAEFFPNDEEVLKEQQEEERRKKVETKVQLTLKKIRPPIIIVPPALSSILTLYNVKDLLQNNHFVTTEQRKKEFSKKPDYVILKRAISKNQSEEYMVIDNPTKLTDKEWSRVIAVFITGQEWQFRGWSNENPTHVLNKIKGFHVKYQGEPLKENIAKWPVTVLEISSNEMKRHTDQTVVRQFWEKVLSK